MKPYFAKFLPVEGEIKEGDYLIYPIKESIAVQWLGGDLTGYEKKIKLFLCSRDIKVGDNIDCTYWVDGVDFRKVGEIIQTDEFGDHAFTIKSDEGKTKEWIPKEFAYKVIGEISPEATWVKEDDEFDEEEIILHPIFDFDKEDEEDLIGWTAHVKGPCGHFH